MEKTKKKVSISKTNREWEVIDKRISEFLPAKPAESIEAFNRYLNKKILTLIEDYKKNPTEIKTFLCNNNNKKERQKFVNEETYQKLLDMSTHVGIPISIIVDRAIVTPLLIEK